MASIYRYEIWQDKHDHQFYNRLVLIGSTARRRPVGEGYMRRASAIRGTERLRIRDKRPGCAIVIIE